MNKRETKPMKVLLWCVIIIAAFLLSWVTGGLIVRILDAGSVHNYFATPRHAPILIWLAWLAGKLVDPIQLVLFVAFGIGLRRACKRFEIL